MTLSVRMQFPSITPDCRSIVATRRAPTSQTGVRFVAAMPNTPASWVLEYFMVYKTSEKERERRKRSYKNHKEKALECNRRVKMKCKEYLKELRTDTPCADCKQKFPYYVLQFDHTEDNKTSEVSKLAHNGMTLKLMAEVKKCEIVCANCHTIRTYRRSHALV